jgi:hypothetical protein
MEHKYEKTEDIIDLKFENKFDDEYFTHFNISNADYFIKN